MEERKDGVLPERKDMKLSVISFTENGKQLSESIVKLLEKELEIKLYTKCEAGIKDDIYSDILFLKKSVGDWAKERMQEQNALLFIGACGIAVRAVAPFLTDKLHDVPVLVMDEKGKYVIPILSGHMGGANDLANHIAEKTGAEAVITTATDLNKKFAVDLFAKRNRLYIANKDGIVKVSSKVLAGKEITMSIEAGHEIIGGESGIRFVPYPPMGVVDVVVTSKDDMFDTSLLLKPREYVIGIGCKKGKKANEIDDFILKAIKKKGISIMQIFALSSISQKRDEQGIVEWCRKEGIPFFTYTAEDLREVNGTFTKSMFVKNQVGVDNVCERAAVKACGEDGKLILPKVAENGMTIAVAKREWKVCFDEE
ncbi:cobalamin biosynthesis protein [uncultured Phocaeicola sp.]|uniref:cobalt-precorrin 5A hydrolase n=1 Tax=uncultured Phocaeicola sp. TaxID=990718 RepID=UPI00321FF4D7